VSPLLAYDTASTLAAGKELFVPTQRPNLLIKIPGAKQSLAAVGEAIFAGIPINVTLLFSLEQYLMIASKCFMGGQSTLCVELAFFGCLFGVLPS
jgi:transaldolase